MRQIFRLFFNIFCLLALAACTSLETFSGSQTTLGRKLNTNAHRQMATNEASKPNGRTAGKFIEYGDERSLASNSTGTDPDLSHISAELNFSNATAKEFSNVFFAEILNLPYTIDPDVDGIITLQTGSEVSGSTALKLARQAMQSNGNAIEYTQGVFRIRRAPNGGWNSDSTSSIALKNIDAESAVSALDQMMPGRAEFIVMNHQTLGVRGDTEAVSAAQELVKTLDIDQFRSSSFGLFPLRSANANAIADELQGLYENAGRRNVYLLPIQRMNALLIASKQKSDLQFAEKWLPRLDASNHDVAQLNTYKVRHRDAEELSKIVAEIFQTEGADLSTEGEFSDAPAQQSNDSSIKITPDKRTNTILIWSSQRKFERIKSALRRLDTKVDQVYVEATIAEVRLSNELNHGVKWFLESGVFSAGLSDNSSGAIAESFPGFNFAMKVPHAKVVISALEDFTDVKVVSSPTLTVLDRETATIQVGDQVPIVTKTVQDSAAGVAVVANEIQFRDTGIILEITPIIQPSGNVVLNIEQEVSQVTKTTTSSINSPTISQRRVNSTVSVKNGTAIILGGLISSHNSDNQSGLPGTKKTIFQSIFGSREAKSSRSELLIFVRPVILNNQTDIHDIANEIANSMPNVSAITGSN